MNRTLSMGPTQPLRSGERFVNLTVPQSYAPSAPNGGTDDYRCQVIDPHLSEPAFLIGAQLEPGNPAIVHHAITFAIPPVGATDRDGAQPLLTRLRALCPRVRHVWADGGYAGALIDGATQHLQLRLQIVRRTDKAPGFVVLPRRGWWNAPWPGCPADAASCATTNGSHTPTRQWCAGQ